MGIRGSAPKCKVIIQWSPQFAYAIGLITSDGSLSKDGRHISFTSKDRDLAELFKRCLGINNVIGRKARGSEWEKKYFHVQFGDINFYRFLCSIGLMPAKSKRIGPLVIPDQYFFDFLRGCFDGDGCIYSYWDPRWHSSYMYYLDICSASFQFLVWLQQSIERLGGVKGRIQRSTRVLELVFAKQATKAILVRMYYAPALPMLRRKFIKSKQILVIDSTHSRAGVGTW